jgi:class 3 adenylate cyclase
MEERQTEQTEACIIFVDLINSSALSSFIGPLEYARWILLFQDLFERLAGEYFNSPNKKSFIRTAGDEGFAFIPKWVFEPEIAAYKAICFAFELKTLAKLMPYNIFKKAQEDMMPFGLRLAVGIHSGMVTYTSKPVKDKGNNGKWHNEVDKYIGYNINYAKRIETCSREGRYTNIFVSREVYEMLISKKPIFFEHHRSELKGIEKTIDVYEARSAFIQDEPIRNLFNDEFLQYFRNIKNEYWLKSYYLSILSQLNNTAKGISNKEYYETEFRKELFRYLEIDDPIVEFIQAIEYEIKGDLTLSIEKLKKVLHKYPGFIYAKIRLLEMLLKLLRNPNNQNPEIIYLIDSARELLDYYPSYLTDKEKERLKSIQKEAEMLKNK